MGLPCQFDYSNRGGLLPHLFTLTSLHQTALETEACPPKVGGIFSVALAVEPP